MSFRVKREQTTGGKVAGGNKGSNQASRMSAPSPTSTTFTLSMTDAETSELLKQLDALTRKLSMFPTERVMYEYRCLVGELMRRSMRAYQLKKDMRWRRSDKSLFVTIEKIESDLNELGEVFQREGLRTRGFSILEEIKGCLISILV